MSDELDTRIKVGFDLDKESEKDSKKSFKDMAALVADLGIIGKITGDSLGKLWKHLSGTIKFGVGEFNSSINALVKGFDSSELARLNEALAGIGAPGKASSVVNRIDELVRAYQNPELMGEKISAFEETMGRSQATSGERAGIVAALQQGDAPRALMAIADYINASGEEGSNIADMMGFSALQNLDPSGGQFDKFMQIMAGNSAVYERNITALDRLADSMAQLKATNDGLKSAFAAAQAPWVEALSNKWREAAEKILSRERNIREGNWEAEFSENELKAGEWYSNLMNNLLGEEFIATSEGSPAFVERMRAEKQLNQTMKDLYGGMVPTGNTTGQLWEPSTQAFLKEWNEKTGQEAQNFLEINIYEAENGEQVANEIAEQLKELQKR